MKNSLTIISLLIVCSMATAQNPLTKGSNQLNFGLGLSGWGVPVYIGIDHGVSSEITLGGEISYRSYNNNYAGYKYNHSITGILVNGNYHFNQILKIPKEWDFYAGLNLGFYLWSSPSGYNGSGSSGLGIGAQVGGRYYLSKKVGLNLELGGGNAFSNGKFGLTIKL